MWRAVRDVREAHPAWAPGVGALTAEEERAVVEAEAAKMAPVTPGCMLEEAPAAPAAGVAAATAA